MLRSMPCSSGRLELNTYYRNESGSNSPKQKSETQVTSARVELKQQWIQKFRSSRVELTGDKEIQLESS